MTSKASRSACGINKWGWMAGLGNNLFPAPMPHPLLPAGLPSTSSKRRHNLAFSSRFSLIEHLLWACVWGRSIPSSQSNLAEAVAAPEWSSGPCTLRTIKDKSHWGQPSSQLKASKITQSSGHALTSRKRLHTQVWPFIRKCQAEKGSVKQADGFSKGQTR